MTDRITGLKAALDLTPDNHVLRLMLAEALKESSYPKEALKHYAVLLEKGQMLESVLVPAGLLAIDVGELDAARLYLQTAQKLELDDTDGLEEKLDALLVATTVETEPLNPLAEALELAPSIAFEDVGGLEGVKKVIERLIILPFKRPELFEKYGQRAGGGVLMYGPPGCGKTMLARATAGECKLPFYNVRIEHILSKYIGESEQNLHGAFELARQHAPCVLFIDELDALAFARRKQSSSHGRSLVDQLLQELDAIGSNNEGLLVMAATNAPWDVDDAMLRPGRFDRRIFVSPPDESARRSILRLHLSQRHAERVDEKRLAQKTSLFSGADLRALVEQGVERVIDEALMTDSEPPLSMKHLEAALAELQPSTTEWLRRARNYVEFSNQDKRYEDVAKYLRSPEAKRIRK